MIPRAMVPGPEPWKSLIRHRVSQLQLRRDGDWTPSALWLCTAVKVKPQGSMLWKAIWMAWVSVRPGILKSNAITMDERLRQPLFFNPEILAGPQRPFGMEANSRYRRWSNLGINMVKDIWLEADQRFIGVETLQARTRSQQLVPLRNNLIRQIPWDLFSHIPLKVGDWLTADIRSIPTVFFQLKAWTGDFWTAQFFVSTDGTEQLQRLTEVPRWFFHWSFQRQGLSSGMTKVKLSHSTPRPMFPLVGPFLLLERASSRTFPSTRRNGLGNVKGL